jgi:hypothetical protein
MAFKHYSQNHYHFPRPVGAQFHWTGLKYFVGHNNLETGYSFFKRNNILHTSVIQWRYSPTGLWPTERPPPVSEASANFCE